MYTKNGVLKKVKSIVLIWVLFFYGQFIYGQFNKPDGIIVDFSGANEFDPVFSFDGEKFAFISNKTGKDKIYICYFLNNQWSEPQEIEAINQFNGGQGNIRYPSFNYDARILYFSADFNKDSSDIDIFYSKFKKGSWTEPVSVGYPINTLAYDGQPSISSDDKNLYFTRNNPDAEEKNFDCKTIYVSKKNIAKQSWLLPKKLPIPINVGCEQTPKIGIDNKTLYYSSLRDGGKGGFDIYKTKLIAKNVWIPAESIDTLNTQFNDFSPTVSYNSDFAYYAITENTRREVSSKIHTKKIPSQYLADKTLLISGILLDRTTQEPLQVDIKVNDPYSSRTVYSFSSDAQTGAYAFYLPHGNKYQIDYQKNGYSHCFHSIDAQNIKENKELTKDVKLFPSIKLLLNVFDDEIYESIDAMIEIRDQDSLLIETPIEKVKNGRYRLELPIGNNYKISISANYFEYYNFDFDLDKIILFDEFEKDVELKAKKLDFEINVSDEATQAGIPVELVITNLDNNEVLRTSAAPDSEGKYKIKLRAGNRYNVSISPKGYSFYNTTVDLKKKKAPKKLEVKLKQLKEDTKLTLNDITFETNSADLNESSYLELDRVVKLMIDNPDIKIEISAHTDDVGSSKYNLRLSDRRAKSVIIYMLDSDIDTNRLIAKGYGESTPIVPNDSDENKAKNRRVELKILEVEKS
ncbi:MAG: hypothetical protein B6I20_04840 [Bacteroidetes bacterium 4572_117]|nr:MAG: hypothetical protein B6I20_04840 [Bacteroidetes bacterium 4572_117]